MCRRGGVRAGGRQGVRSRGVTTLTGGHLFALYLSINTPLSNIYPRVNAICDFLIRFV